MSIKKLIIAITIIVAVIIIFFAITIHLVGDKPRKGAKVLYLGPSKIDNVSDKEYAAAISKAINYEKDGAIKDAIINYEYATKINRYYLPSYYPILDIARLNCKLGNKEEAQKNIYIFLEYAKDEVNPSDMSSFTINDNTIERIDYVKKLINEANKLSISCR